MNKCVYPKSSSVRLELNQYPVLVSVGYLDEERMCPQQLLVSLRLEYKALLVAPEVYQDDSAEDIADMIDYGALITFVDQYSQKIRRSSSVRLLETYCRGLMDQLLETYPQLQDLEVSVQKPALDQGLCRGGQVSLTLRI